MFRIILILTYVILFTSSCNLDREIAKSENLTLQKLLDKIPEADNFENAQLVKKALDIVDKHQGLSDSTLTRTYYVVGGYYHSIGKIDSASIYYQKGIGSINDSIQSDLEIWVFRKAHQAYQSLGAYEECAAISTKFKSLIDMESDAKNKATYYGLKEEYFKSNPLKNIDSILKYNQLGIEVLRLSNQHNQAANIMITRAACITSFLRDYDRSSKIFDEIIEMEDSLLTDTKRLLYNDYGVLKYFQGDYQSAINYYKKGLGHIDTHIDKRNRLANGYGNIAEAFLQLNDFTNANTYLDSLRSIEKSGIEERFQIFLKHLELELEFKKEQDISKSIKSLKRYASELRSTNAEKYKSDLITLEQTLETRKKVLEEGHENRKKFLNQRWFSYFLGFALLCIMLFGYLFYRQKKIKFELQHLLLHQRLLRSQMNPHFTYNFLSIIKSHIKTNPSIATEYLLKFSRLLRMILDNSTLNYVELDTELEILAKYVELQKIGFPNGISFKRKYHNMDEDDLIYIPPMIVQPILENCIVHGFANIDYKGEILFTLTKEENFIRCEIEDNGSGIKIKKDQQRKSSTKLISEFLEKTTNKKLELINKPNGLSGTIVRFSLPYKYTSID